jgi:hypothetical protein
MADDWLMIPVVDQLVAAGTILAAGQYYSYRALPILDGSYTADTRMPFPIHDHFTGWGSVQGQIADVPDGLQVVRRRQTISYRFQSTIVWFSRMKACLRPVVNCLTTP